MVRFDLLHAGGSLRREGERVPFPRLAESREGARLV